MGPIRRHAFVVVRTLLDGRCRVLSGEWKSWSSDARVVDTGNVRITRCMRGKQADRRADMPEANVGPRPPVCFRLDATTTILGTSLYSSPCPR